MTTWQIVSFNTDLFVTKGELSSVALDHVEAGPALRAALRDLDAALDALWLGGPQDPADWLRRHGWTPRVRELAEVAREKGRTVHPEYDPAQGGRSHARLVSGTS